MTLVDRLKGDKVISHDLNLEFQERPFKLVAKYIKKKLNSSKKWNFFNSNQRRQKSYENSIFHFFYFNITLELVKTSGSLIYLRKFKSNFRLKTINYLISFYSGFSLHNFINKIKSETPLFFLLFEKEILKSIILFVFFF